MKYFIIEGTFRNPLPIGKEELTQAIARHIAYLQKGFDEGWILTSGPKAAGGGGVIVMKAKSQEIVESILASDPFTNLGVQNYRIIEFRFHDGQPGVKEWFGVREQLTSGHE
ncbi:MAG: hypothetical protein KKA07_03625 [Bacteroidetes bacterium]|nr:hypothetical protein [Bacteroidota bacterium]MBU1718143.1 hypothetical protein [Bacteroidota bacterium]